MVAAPSAGMKWTMMRHGVKLAKLGRPADQRKALLRALVTSLIRHGSIRTTKVKAMAMRKWVDKMITLAKDGSLHARRQALGYIYDKELVQGLFLGVPDRYATRMGGYTRIKTEPFLRRGDAAQMAVIELVE
jgi:large subunit ribosomal protein L17